MTDPGVFWWMLARVGGLGAYTALAIALLSGVALRTALFERLATNRALRSLHDFTLILWVPLGALHLAALVLDPTARVGVRDLGVPFLAPVGTLGLGLGTLALWALVATAVSGWLRTRLARTSTWLHRLSYAAFALVFAHALLSGTDFSDPVVSALTWGAAASLAVLGVARLAGGRLAT